MNYAYYHSKKLDIYKNETQFVEDLARQDRKMGILQYVLLQESMPGIIALVILFCMVGILVHDPENPKVPDVLSNALALILGFYFGKNSNL